MTLDFRVYHLPLRNPFTISRYTVTIQQTMIAIISDGEISGYGEATANPYYHSTVEKLSEGISKVAPIISEIGLVPPDEFWKIIFPHLQDNYFALCAIDVAYWDYYARKNNRTLRSYWSDGNEKLPMTSFTIGLDTLEMMKQKIAENPWPIYKIKLGSKDDDMRIVEELRKTTDAVFRVDANAAWNAQQAIQFSHILKDLNVEFIEQPLPASNVEGMKNVKAESALPVIADESCQREEDVLACGDTFHGINIKLMKCGGITPALRMIREARNQGLSLMVGCMTESTVGISALAQLAPLLDYLDADGALLLAEDAASGVTFREGKIVYRSTSGSGAHLY